MGKRVHEVKRGRGELRWVKSEGDESGDDGNVKVVVEDDPSEANREEFKNCDQGGQNDNMKQGKFAPDIREGGETRKNDGGEKDAKGEAPKASLKGFVADTYASDGFADECGGGIAKDEDS